MRHTIIINKAFHAAWSDRDEEALRKSTFQVESFDSFVNGVIPGFLNTAWKLISRRNVVWIHQSAGFASTLPCLFGRFFGHRNIIIAVGTDCANFPEIEYGNFRRWDLRLATRFSMRHADLICPVHKSMEQYDYSYWDVKYKKQGFRSFIPSLTTPVFPIENGFESTKWSVLSNYQERTFDVLAAFVIGADNRSILKGADLIIDIAQRNPDWKFKIIGSVDNAVEVPKNCVVIENCSQSELLYHYNDAKVFLQPSITEGFPNTLGEAMACGCYPIGSNVSAIPEIIGSFGLVLMSRNSLELERLVAQALMEIDSGQVNPNLISDSIFERFSIERRASKLLEAIDLVTSESSEFARISGSLPNTRRR